MSLWTSSRRTSNRPTSSRPTSGRPTSGRPTSGRRAQGARGAGALAVLAAVAALGLAGCRDKGPPPAQVIHELRDIFPFPAITGAGDDTTEYEPLQPGYFVYIKGEDFDRAAAMFAEVAVKHPQLIEARFLEGVSLVLADRDKEAVPVLEGVVKERPEYAPAHWFLGQALFATGRSSEALEHLRTVERIGLLYADEARRVLTAAERHGQH